MKIAALSLQLTSFGYGDFQRMPQRCRKWNAKLNGTLPETQVLGQV